MQLRVVICLSGFFYRKMNKTTDDKLKEKADEKVCNGFR